MKSHASGIWFRCGNGVERSFKVGDERLHRSVIRLASPRRRHHSTAKLADSAFPDGAVFGDVGDIHRVEHQPGCFCALVVARNAVLIQQCLLRSDLRRCRLLHQEQ